MPMPPGITQKEPMEKPIEKQYINEAFLFAAIEETLDQGYQASFTVTGMSMWPFLCHGRDNVILDKCQVNNLKRGDIVLYQIPVYDKYILHRITSLKGYQFECTGDGNLHRDGYYPKDQIKARVVKIIRDGKELSMDDPRMKVLSQIWMLLYPLRRMLLKFLKLISKYKRKRPENR